MKRKATIDEILSIICNVFESYSVVLFIDKGNKQYEIISYFSLGHNIISDARILPGQGLVGWIAKHNRPLMITNFDQKKNFLGYYNLKSESEIKSFMGCPLPHKNGILCLDSKKQYSFTPKDQKIYQQFAELLGCFLDSFCRKTKMIEQQRYYHSFKVLLGLRDRLPRWEPFLLHFLNTLSKGAGFKHVFLCVSDEWEQLYWLEGCNNSAKDELDTEIQLKVGMGIIGWIFKNQAPVFLEEKEGEGRKLTSLFGANLPCPDYKSLVCLPIYVDRKTKAVLALADKRAFGISEENKQFCTMVAEYLSIFLENLYLKNRVSQDKIKRDSIK